jgi:hypothetical protein
MMPAPPPATLFLLSPANTSGERVKLLTRPQAGSTVARQLRTPEGALLVDVFRFLSSLYFRGKLAYARRFATPPAMLPGTYVIVPGQGLRLETQRLTLAELEATARIEVAADNRAFTAPLRRDAEQLASLLSASARVVLLGSIATGKYVDVLLEVFGERLLFPREFVGRGDMSRGALLLRSARTGDELEYAAVAGTVRRGPRARRIAELAAKPRHGSS